jgi:hypothetical protein
LAKPKRFPGSRSKDQFKALFSGHSAVLALSVLNALDLQDGEFDFGNGNNGNNQAMKPLRHEPVPLSHVALRVEIGLQPVLHASAAAPPLCGLKGSRSP